MFLLCLFFVCSVARRCLVIMYVTVETVGFSSLLRKYDMKLFMSSMYSMVDVASAIKEQIRHNAVKW